MQATEKQLKVVNKIIDIVGVDEVNKYINKHFKDVNMDNLTKQQAQKIITGLDYKLPKRVINNVFGRDFDKIKF